MMWYQGKWDMQLEFQVSDKQNTSGLKTLETTNTFLCGTIMQTMKNSMTTELTHKKMSIGIDFIVLETIKPY